MKETTCWECKSHEVFIDDGFDSCICWNKKATSKNHTNNCMGYVTNDDFIECPYFEPEEGDA